MSAITLFPTAISVFFEYNLGYSQVYVLENGVGYWAKFNANQNVTIIGTYVNNSSISVNQGWNLIGPFSSDVLTNQITTIPSNIIASSFYGYEEDYTVVDTLKVGKGYWVKTNADGILQLNSELKKAAILGNNNDNR